MSDVVDLVLSDEDERVVDVWEARRLGKSAAEDAMV